MFDDPFTDGEPHAAAGEVCGTVETFKEIKDLLLVAWIEAARDPRAAVEDAGLL
jgi:hypothetical protein